MRRLGWTGLLQVFQSPLGCFLLRWVGVIVCRQCLVSLWCLSWFRLSLVLNREIGTGVVLVAVYIVWWFVCMCYRLFVNRCDEWIQ